MNSIEINNRIDLQIRETETLIKTKEEECKARETSLPRHLLFNLFNHTSPRLQLNCLKELLRLLKLLYRTNQRKENSENIIKLSQGTGDYIHHFHIDKTPIYEYGVGDCIGNIYTKPERQSLFYKDRTTQCFFNARKLAEDIMNDLLLIAQLENQDDAAIISKDNIQMTPMRLSSSAV